VLSVMEMSLVPCLELPELLSLDLLGGESILMALASPTNIL
jgi:hypothetical protein